MGNCQAAEAATVVIQHPGGSKMERIYWSVSAHEIMNSNPGHYVALLVTSPSATSSETENGGVPLKLLKILRPDDTLLIGHVYRLISFEDMVTQFTAKKCIKLEKPLKERSGAGVEIRRKELGGPNPNPDPTSIYDKSTSFMVHRLGNNSGSTSSVSSGFYRGVGRPQGGGLRQWKPALQSISEIGT